MRSIFSVCCAGLLVCIHGHAASMEVLAWPSSPAWGVTPLIKHMGVMQPVDRDIQKLIGHRLTVPQELKPRGITPLDRDERNELGGFDREVYFRNQEGSEFRKKREEVERQISERLDDSLKPVFEQLNESNSTLLPLSESDGLKVNAYERQEFDPEPLEVLLEGVSLPVVQEYGQGQSGQSGERTDGEGEEGSSDEEDSDEEEDDQAGGHPETVSSVLSDSGCQVDHQSLISHIHRLVDDPALSDAEGARLALVGGALTGFFVSTGARFSVRCAAVVSLALIYPAVFVVGRAIYFSKEQADKVKTEQVAHYWSGNGGWSVHPLTDLQKYMKNFYAEHHQHPGFNLYRHLMAPLLIVMAYTQRMNYQRIEITKELFDKVSRDFLHNPGSSSAEDRQNELLGAQISNQQQLAAQSWIVQNLPDQAWRLVAQMASSQLILNRLSGLRELEPGFYIFNDLIGVQMLTVSISQDTQGRRLYAFFRNPSFFFMTTYCAECVEGLISTVYQVHQKNNIQFTGSITRLNAPDFHINIFGPLPDPLQDIGEADEAEDETGN